MTELEDMEARAERRGRSGPTSSANTTYLLQFEHGERDVFGFRDVSATELAWLVTRLRMHLEPGSSCLVREWT